MIKRSPSGGSAQSMRLQQCGYCCVSQCTSYQSHATPYGRRHDIPRTRFSHKNRRPITTSILLLKVNSPSEAETQISKGKPADSAMKTVQTKASPRASFNAVFAITVDWQPPIHPQDNTPHNRTPKKASWRPLPTTSLVRLLVKKTHNINLLLRWPVFLSIHLGLRLVVLCCQI